MRLPETNRGKDLRMMRKEAGITQRELGTVIGLGHSAMSKIETGQQEPSLDQLYKWADACGFTVGIYFSRKAYFDPIGKDGRRK